MTFAHPALLHLFWLVVLLPVLFVFANRSSAKARGQLLSNELLAKLAPGRSVNRSRWKSVLQVVSLACLVLALAGPRVGTREVTVKRRGIDLIIALDVSNSMLARDIPPSRLAKAKREISAFLEKLDGDRVGLVAFAGDAYLQCPLTLDYGAARMFLDVLDPGSVTRQGTNLGAAIETAIRSFPEGEDKYKAIVLVTDGEDLAGVGQRAAEEAGKRGIRIETIGVGSESGEPIPEASDGSVVGGFKRGPSGEIVMTKLDPESLERIALAAGGQFHRATTGELELDRLHANLSQLEEREIGQRTMTLYEERFQIPLAFAILLLIVEWLLSDRARRKESWRGRFA